MNTRDFRASSRDYLTRARMRMAEDRAESLVYAALKLRAGVEARYHEYLDAWAHVSDNVKKGWQLAMLGKEAQKAFRVGDQVVQVTISGNGDEDVRGVIYHTPISRALHKRSEKLGGFLHAARNGAQLKSAWWDKLVDETNLCAEALQAATMGILLGPPLKWGKRIQANIEIPPGYDADGIRALMSDREGIVVMDFAYLPELPNPLPAKAIVWRSQ